MSAAQQWFVAFVSVWIYVGIASLFVWAYGYTGLQPPDFWHVLLVVSAIDTARAFVGLREGK